MNQTAGTAKLPSRTKWIYGIGDWGNTTTSTIQVFFFAYFLTDIARLEPLYAAPVLLIGGIWDAINDPIIGLLLDRVHTRWGRRRPFFLFGALPLAISFILLLWVPPISSQIGKALYYCLAYIFFDTAFTAMVIPYGALVPDLTDDYDERTSLNGWRMGVSMIGGLIATVSVPLLAGAFDKPATGYFAAGLIFGVLAAGPYLLLFANTRERFAAPSTQPLNIKKSFLATFRNRPFRYVAGIYMFSWISVNLVASLMVYYLTYYLGLANRLEVVLGIVQASALICIPIILKLSERVGKASTYMIGAASWAVVMLLLAFIAPYQHTLAYVLAVCTGLGVAAAHVIPWALLPDVIEVDELATGERREGAYYGFIVFLQKGGTALIMAVVQWILHLTGYVPDAVQNPQALWAIRLLFGALPAALLGVSIVLAARFPLNRARHAAMVTELAARRAAD